MAIKILFYLFTKGKVSDTINVTQVENMKHYKVLHYVTLYKRYNLKIFMNAAIKYKNL